MAGVAGLTSKTLRSSTLALDRRRASTLASNSRTRSSLSLALLWVCSNGQARKSGVVKGRLGRETGGYVGDAQLQDDAQGPRPEGSGNIRSLPGITHTERMSETAAIPDVYCRPILLFDALHNLILLLQKRPHSAVTATRCMNMHTTPVADIHMENPFMKKVPMCKRRGLRLETP